MRTSNLSIIECEKQSIFTKKLLTINLFFLFFCFSLSAQITMDSNGKLGLRSTTTGTEDVIIGGTGELKISNGTTSLYLKTYYGTPQIYPL
jgi:hypothetical protein